MVSSVDGVPPEDDLAMERSYPKPIYTVVDASQLPIDFLAPSPYKRMVVGFDCEGVELCRFGPITLMQLAFPDAIYLVDVFKGGWKLMRACKPALESWYITKVIHDCKRDSEALFFQHGIMLNNVWDTQIAYSLIEEQEGRRKSHDVSISFVALIADPRYCGISYPEKEEIRNIMRQDGNFWSYRPLTDLMVRAAVDDVRFLFFIYHKMMEKLTAQSVQYLYIRGALYCRCFCITTDADQAYWPPLPALPAGMEEEVLSVVDVPPGQMGRIIGRGGVAIRALKESRNAEIIIGGSKGPCDKVFVIGPSSEVFKALAIMRGKLTY
ncbi:unnamed protein product [Rhodiola kirilowii]